MPNKKKRPAPARVPRRVAAARPVVARPRRTSPEPLEAEALRLFAQIEASAGADARKLAELAAERTLEFFVRKMGHDFVKPINSLYGTHDRLTTLLAQTELNHAALVANAAEHLEAVRHFVRLLTRTRDAVLSVRPHMCEEPVAPLVEEVRAAVVAELGERAARFDFTADVEEGLTFHLDHPFLSRALVDLVKNGAEAYPATTPRNPVHLAARSRGRAVEILVTDEGYGWAPETLSYAFVPFATSKPKGTGLGLYLARRVVEDLHGGRLVLESDGRDRGTRARLVLPRSQAGVRRRRRLTEDEIFEKVARRHIARAKRA